MSKKYEKFMEEYNQKKYVSMTAEYRRSTRKTTKINISAKKEDIFKKIVLQTLRKTGENPKYLMVGDKIETKKSFAYVHKYKENKIFSYIYKGLKSEDYFIVTFEIEPTTRKYCIVSYTYETKLDRTIAGFNGILGNRKFKKQARQLGEAILGKLKKICEKK